MSLQDKKIMIEARIAFINSIIRMFEKEVFWVNGNNKYVELKDKGQLTTIYSTNRIDDVLCFLEGMAQGLRCIDFGG